MTWTPDRPTKPGKYWVSIGIEDREKFASDVCREPHHVYLLDIFEEGGGLWLDGVVEVGHCLPASALFNRYVEPADPHAQPVDRDAIPETRAYRMSNDPKTPNLRLILTSEPGMVTLYEADMTSRSDTAQETERHDKIVMSPDDARWLRDQLVALFESEGM